MLTIFSGAAGSDCAGISRRNFLQVGTLGLGGLMLPQLLEARARAAEQQGHVTDKSVVFLFLNGGPTQYETFDPKMDGPSEIRSLTGEVKTSLAGVTFGGTFPKLAALASRLAVVRSFVPGNASHDGGVKLLSGGQLLKASLGAVYSRMAGTGHPRSGMPTNVFLSPQSVGVPAAQSPFNYKGPFDTGILPAAYAPFHPTAAGQGGPKGKGKNARAGGTQGQTGSLLGDMTLRLSPEQLENRRALLRQLDQLRAGLDAGGAVEDLDRYQQQAYEVLLRGVSSAFDLKKEDPRTLARYDTSHIRTPDELAKKLTQTRSHSPIGLGKQLLLARRLCEAGCGVVTVGMTGWDMHGNNGFGILDGMATLGPAVDHALAAFLQDVADRGLSDRILLVVAGEMGRTPRIVQRTAQMNRSVTRAGRDHWANIGALLLAGGGLRMGQVVGASDRQGGKPAAEPVTPPQLIATIMHTLFDVGVLRVTQGLPADLVRLISDGQPIRELV